MSSWKLTENRRGRNDFILLLLLTTVALCLLFWQAAERQRHGEETLLVLATVGNEEVLRVPLTADLKKMREAAVSGRSSGQVGAQQSVDGRTAEQQSAQETIEPTEPTETAGEGSGQMVHVFFDEAGFTIETGIFSNHFVVETDDAGQVGLRCDAANCPDLVCVETGRISMENELIVCLPHRLSLRLVPMEGA